MDKKYIHYPNFNSGEVLTSEKLNNITVYSDGQMQLTRTNLLGFGIVSGLTYNYVNETLTIQPGVAITPNGKAISFEEPIKYGYMEKNEDGEYLLLEKPTGNATLLKKLDEQVLVIRYEIVAEKTHQCRQDTCDIINVHTIVKFQPKLVDVRNLKKTCVVDTFSFTPLRLSRFNDVAGSLVTNYLHDNVRSCFYENVNLIISRYEEIKERFSKDDSPLRFLFYQKNASVCTLHTEFNNALQVFERLKFLSRNPNKISNIGRLEMSNIASPEIPVYYLHFLEDIEDAYNEWGRYYASFLKKYKKLLFRPNVIKDADTVMIGKDGSDDDFYRNHFIPADKSSIEADIQILEAYLHRMCAMVACFYRTSYRFDSMTATIESIRPGTPLNCRPIPFYYRCDDKGAFRRAWMLDTSVAEVTSSDPHSNAFNNPNDCYQVGGYYNRPVEKVVAELNDIIRTQNLHLTVEEIELQEIKKQWYDDLKKSFTTTIDGKRPRVYGITKKIYGLKDDLMNLVGRSYQLERIGLVDRRTLMESIKQFDLEQAKKEPVLKSQKIRQIQLSLSRKMKLTFANNIQLNFPVLGHLQNIADQCLSEKYHFADHRFIPRKSILYVATFKGKAIFCFGA